MAAVALAGQIASAVAAPVICVAEQHADGAALASSLVVLTEQHADLGGGSLAAVRLVEQSAVTASTAYRPASMAASDGTQQWYPRYIRISSGTGSWDPSLPVAGVLLDEALDEILDEGGNAIEDE